MARDVATPRRPEQRRTTERRNRDDEVLAVAIEVMAEKGYTGTSVQEVADRVGVLKGSLYHYFSSKEDLLFRIVEESHRQTKLIAEECSALGLSPLEELLEYVRRSSTWYLDNRQRANIFFTERRHLTGERLTESNSWGRFFERHLQDLVGQAQERGEIRVDLDVRLLTRYVIGSVNSVIQWPSRSGKKFAVADMADALVALTRSALVSAE